LKPENIMIRDLADGQELAVIIDFGIATVLDSEVPPSAATMVAGSRYYIAPEQLEGKPEAASDIYALGEIAFEMVTGSRPFRAGPAVDLYQQQRHGPEQNPCALRSDLPPAAGAVILKALSFNAASRHARAAEFGVEFEGAVTGQRSQVAAGVEPETRRSQLQTRMLDVGMQAQVPIYEPAELVALIRRTESAGLKAMVEIDHDFSIKEEDVRSRLFQIEFPRDHAGRAQPLELTLSVTSPDFEPKEQSKVILLPPDRDSEAYTFLLTPQHLGELRLTLEVRLGAVHIASKIIKTHAERSERITATAGRTLVSIPIQVLVDMAGALPAGGHWERPEPVTQAPQPSPEVTGALRLLPAAPGQPAPSEAGEFTRSFQQVEETRRERKEEERKGPRESTQHMLNSVRPPVAARSSQDPAVVSSAPAPPFTERSTIRGTAGDQPVQPCAATEASPVPRVKTTPVYRRLVVLAPVAIAAVLLGYGLFNLQHSASQLAPPAQVVPLMPSRPTEPRADIVAPPAGILPPRADQIHWRGSLAPGKRLAIHGATCSQGSIANGGLPRAPIQVDASSLPQGLQIAERPSTRNGFTLRLRNIGAVPIIDFTLYYRPVK
jgi:hypothetical protein